jgi:ribosomal protein L15E
MATKKKSQTPWKRSAPKKSHHTKLTAKSKAKARASAKRAGRKYPNLVDNMNAAKKQRRPGRKSSARK